jgi:hypothetical protein
MDLEAMMAKSLCDWAWRGDVVMFDDERFQRCLLGAYKT